MKGLVELKTPELLCLSCLYLGKFKSLSKLLGLKNCTCLCVSWYTENYFGEKKGGFFFPRVILAYTHTWCDLTVVLCENLATENQLVYHTDGFQAGLSYIS